MKKEEQLKRGLYVRFKKPTDLEFINESVTIQKDTILLNTSIRVQDYITMWYQEEHKYKVNYVATVKLNFILNKDFSILSIKFNKEPYYSLLDNDREDIKMCIQGFLEKLLLNKNNLECNYILGDNFKWE